MAADNNAPAVVKMGNKKLGNTGLFVSELCLGAMTFGTTEKNNWGMPTALEEESCKMMDTFVAAGGNFIDTANVYGDSEQVVGRWLSKRRREEIVVATKARNPMGPGPNDTGLSRKHIMASVQDSLRKLQTDYIDLYQVHSFDVDTPLKETFKALDDLVRAGKIRYIGISNFSGYQLQKTIDLVNHMGWDPIVCLQPQYNLLCRSVEWDLVPICVNEGVGIIPWSPLAGGWLAARMTRDSGPQAGSRVAWAEGVGWRPTGWSSKKEDDQTWKIVDTVVEIGKEIGKSAAQVSLRWLMQKKGVTSPIIGAKNLNQLKDNLGAVGWELTAEQMEKLDSVSATPIPYPWGETWNRTRNRPPLKA